MNFSSAYELNSLYLKSFMLNFVKYAVPPTSFWNIPPVSLRNSPKFFLECCLYEMNLNSFPKKYSGNGNFY